MYVRYSVVIAAHGPGHCHRDLPTGGLAQAVRAAGTLGPGLDLLDCRVGATTLWWDVEVDETRQLPGADFDGHGWFCDLKARGTAGVTIDDASPAGHGPGATAPIGWWVDLAGSSCGHRWCGVLDGGGCPQLCAPAHAMA